MKSSFIKRAAAALLALGCVALAGPTQAAQDEPVTVGFTVYAMSGWVSSGKEGVEAVAKANNVDLRWASANGSVASQVAQVKQFIAQNVDAIIIDPVDSSALGPQIKEAKSRGIEVIGTNVKIFPPGAQYLTSYVGPNDVLAGENETKALVKKLDGKGNVVILKGPLGQSATIDRTQGIENVLEKHPDIKVLAQRPGNWKRAEGYNITASWLSRYGTKIDGIISENDDMAVGAIRAMRQRRITDIPVVGVDGIKAGLKNVASGRQLMTNLQDAPLQLGMALQVAVNAVHGEAVPQKIMIDMPVVTEDNADKYLKQMYENRQQFLKNLPELIKKNLASGHYGRQ
ncbi:substrate-binding domain-containing protein [Salinisphaera sp.]|uniref:substrate-binding domain-containing protein n=1 Tax=Salinisphaera sp. TaxID=1914330 RepID=UPI002D772A2C|nr:substrate-binding domain-containing protein [Salinisphaera sp.]HET7313482.1 substrate-binding domain-containing protein [Salinisphaera sp.]